MLLELSLQLILLASSTGRLIAGLNFRALVELYLEHYHEDIYFVKVFYCTVQDQVSLVTLPCTFHHNDACLWAIMIS